MIEIELKLLKRSTMKKMREKMKEEMIKAFDRWTRCSSAQFTATSDDFFSFSKRVVYN